MPELESRGIERLSDELTTEREARTFKLSSGTNLKGVQRDDILIDTKGRRLLVESVDACHVEAYICPNRECIKLLLLQPPEYQDFTVAHPAWILRGYWALSPFYPEGIQESERTYLQVCEELVQRGFIPNAS